MYKKMTYGDGASYAVAEWVIPIADMENVVDYVIFLAHGRVLSQGFVEDLREQYRYVHGPRVFAEKYITDHRRAA